MKNAALIPALLAICLHGYGQLNMGPRLLAMGKNTAAIKDTWNTSANIAAVAQRQKTIVAINYLRYSFNNELSNQGIAVVFPLKNTIIGLSAQRYGFTVYNEFKTGVAVTKNFGQKLAIGIQGNYHQIQIKQYGSTKGYSINVGFYYQLNPQIALGFYSTNLMQQHYQNTAIEIPSSLHFGTSYQVSEKLLMASTISKVLQGKTEGNLGLEYQMLQKFALRTGLSLIPLKQYAGLGFSHKKLNIDLAVENDKYLGFGSQIGLQYAF